MGREGLGDNTMNSNLEEHTIGTNALLKKKTQAAFIYYSFTRLSAHLDHPLR
jgi:hypothetical protein